MVRQFSNRTITQDGNGDGCGFTSHRRTPKARKFLSGKWAQKKNSPGLFSERDRET